MSDAQTAYDRLIAHFREIGLLQSTQMLLGWDEQTMMPPAGVEHRSRQLSQLARLAHQMRTDPRVPEWLAACEDSDAVADPLSPAAVNVREIRRTYDRSTRVPERLVGEIASTVSLAAHEWSAAKDTSDFGRFEPWLRRMVELKQEEARCLGWADGGEMWDALAESYEPGCHAKQVEGLFAPLEQRLRPLLDAIRGSERTPSGTINERRLSLPAQRPFVREVVQRMGVDFTRGRLDEAPHPFCAAAHRDDVRMTTRFSETHLVEEALGSSMHEAGHGLYDQGLPADHVGEPMGDAVSFAIHESQARLWENHVGRSRAFWAWCFPVAEGYFGEGLAGLGPDDAFEAANRVEPGPIRVGADEATYNLHILVRFELERALLEGDLSVADLPDAWRQKYREKLGVEVTDDRTGCLQDIHWSEGAFGYFPSYTMGNLYAAAFFEAAEQSIPDLSDAIARGDFEPLRSWLRERIHSQGKRYRAETLAERITGEPLGPEPFVRHLEGKLRPLYGV